MQDLCKFNEITFAIENYNDAFGSMILGAVVAGASYFALTIMMVLNADRSSLGRVIPTVLTLIIYGAQLLAVAEVSRQVKLAF